MTENPEDVPPLGPATGTESVAMDLDSGEEAGDGRPADLPAGTVVADRYEIESTLGRGGYAVVYRAVDRNSGARVAVKVLRPDRLGPVALKRLAREAEAARRFTHPGLVRVLDHGRFNEGAFLVMDLVDGPTLRDRLRSGPMPTDDAIRIASNVLEALEVLHAQSMVHRDVKPSNILLDREGRARLADFGLVTRWEEGQTRATQSEAIVGTLEYVSPEQALGEALDGRSDLYALGVVFYEMLSGAPLHGARSSLGMLVAHLTKPAPDIRASRESVPSWLAAIVAKLLAKGRDERYADAASVLSDLRSRRAPAGTAPAPTGRRRVAAWVAIGALVGAALWAAKRPGTPAIALAPNVVGADAKGGLLRALGDRGEVLWTRDLGAPLSEESFSPSSLATLPRLVVADLDGDGRNEVLIAAPTEPQGLAQFIVFEADGRERFRRKPGRRVRYGSEDFDAFGTVSIYPFIDESGRHHLFTLSMHRPAFPSVLEGLGPHGELLSEYFGSGHQVTLTRLRYGNRSVLALGGFHNETRGGSLTLLALDDANGRAPGERPAYVCSSCRPKDPLALLVMPRPDLVVAAAGPQGSVEVRNILQLEGGIIDVTVVYGSFPDPATGERTEAVTRYDLAPDLSRVEGMTPSGSVSFLHDAYFRNSRIDHRFGARDLTEMADVRRWDGKGWARIPDGSGAK